MRMKYLVSTIRWDLEKCIQRFPYCLQPLNRILVRFEVYRNRIFVMKDICLRKCDFPWFQEIGLMETSLNLFDRKEELGWRHKWHCHCNMGCPSWIRLVVNGAEDIDLVVQRFWG